MITPFPGDLVYAGSPPIKREFDSSTHRREVGKSNKSKSDFSMRLDEAEAIARKFVSHIQPYCFRCEIAGSVRRKKPDGIKDIEIVIVANPNLAIPLKSVLYDNNLMYIEKGKFPGRYLKIIFENKPIDLFITTLECWGCIFLIRTGSENFSHELVRRAPKAGFRFMDGRLWQLAKPLSMNPSQEILPTPLYTPEERDVFRYLGLGYIEPERREFY